MEIRCSLCGAIVELTKVHKDYQRVAADPKGFYVCRRCAGRVQHQAVKDQKPPKPI